MDRHESLLDTFSPQGLGELDLSYGWLPLTNDAGIAHLFRAMSGKPGLQEHLLIRYPNPDGFPPGVGYAVQMVTNHPDSGAQTRKVFEIHWNELGNLDHLSFYDPVMIRVQQGAYSFAAEQGEFYKIPAVLTETGIRQIDRLFQRSTP